ncbi:MAG: ACP S-malonyltransferase [Spirochaetes bacterium]|nr:ACP S-malonyltransferase [Spirochaetota bacterium]
MERKKTAAIFPAFGCKYLGNEREILDGMSKDLHELSVRANSAVGLDIGEFHACRDGCFSDELLSQYAVYIYSCAVSNNLKRFGLHTDYAAGYSMGLYAALCHAESITFEQGLDLITRAYQGIRAVASELPFGIGVISGLTPEDVRPIIAGFDDVEIININNRHNLLISGYEDSVKAILAMAHEQGALHRKYLTFHSPYHSRFMNGAAEQLKKYISSMTIYDPLYPVISTVDQREMTTWQDIAADLAGNINRNINWLATVNHMIADGVDVFIECGPGKSLHRMGKFIDGGFEIYHLQNLQDLLVSDRVCPSASAINY